ncbi:MAG TPA: protein kinase [Polyangiaceae bacterium]|nr:protein kinase [Polyangiaceae bacterium]
MIGELVGGRYHVTSVLGEGGMGVVYLAEQRMGDGVRKVAIKTLHRDLSSDPSLVARFQRECSTVVSLEHPNTIRLYDFGATADGTLYMAMEFVAGRPLSGLIEEGALPAERAVNILRQLCGALGEAHARGIVHRDLKPENVLLSQHGGEPDFVKLLDFGIARTMDATGSSKEKLTQPGMVLGTPQYMSPEQFSGKEVDARSDVYSLGVMTYEMLTGRLPFAAESPVEWAMKHLTEEPAPLEDSIPLTLRTVTMQALSKNRDQRPVSAQDFFEQLAIAAPPVSLAPRSRTVAMAFAPTAPAQPAIALPEPRARRWPLVLALVPASALVGIATFLLLAPPPRSERVRQREIPVTVTTLSAAAAVTSSPTPPAESAPVVETPVKHAPAEPSPTQSVASLLPNAAACDACVAAAKAGNAAAVVVNLALCSDPAGKARCVEASRQRVREQAPHPFPRPSASAP